MPYLSTSRIPEVLQEFVTHANKYAPSGSQFAGISEANLEAALTAVVAKREAKAEADRRADIAGAEFDTAVDAARDLMVRYRAGVKAQLGADAEGTVTLPKLSQRRSPKSAGGTVAPGQ